VHEGPDRKQARAALIANQHVLARVDAHKHYLVIAELRQIEAAVFTDAAAERADQRRYFLRRQHLVEARAFDVQNLALQRQDRLKVPVAALLRTAAGALALDDVELRDRRILAL